MAWCLCDSCLKRDCKNRRKLVVMPNDYSCYSPYKTSNETALRDNFKW